ncbi:hypothetical protein F5X99DRAFT_366417 [Biscogniauxia marginata]|nr:hypothetical protein F5X99DRAFT_366417 [Biscogniauxia marginata]
MAPTRESSARWRWPPGKLPVELFVLIAQFLRSRDDVQAMRLVNHEFNAKLASYYFRHLVVHFGPKLSTTLDTGLPLHVNSPSIDITEHLLGNTSIFDNFGHEIRRFALALELNESDLATPNIDDCQVLEVRPWGMYRWPSQSTRSQSLLQKVTESLENSKGMFRILSHLGEVQELGLSCEGGLGYLRGPDINPLAPLQPLAVFGDPNVIQKSRCHVPALDFEKSYRYEMLERMMHAADVAPNCVPDRIGQLLKTEGITVEQLAREERQRCPLPENRGGSRPLCPACDCCKHRSKTLRLQPDLLTDAQKRLLMQHISAHQALIQSYLLGVIDNAASFVNLTKFKIASLPSFHLDSLCRDDVWSKLPKLEEVSLAVVPDWRKLTEYAPNAVGETQVYPTDALPKVYRLLNNHIGKHQHIKRLHFEWLCGGELAPGRLQRNNHILPAPFLKNHRRIADSRVENLLVLPFITHLSLKNCWFTPQVFFRVIRQMATISLESLNLETVSLTSPPTSVDTGQGGDQPVPPPPDDGGGGQHQNPPAHLGLPLNIPNHTPVLMAFQNLMAHQGRQVPQDLLTNIANHLYETTGDSTPLEAPRSLSWPHIIDMLTPGDTIREHLHKQESNPDEPTGPLHLKKQLKLRTITFKSCGYATIPDSRFISNRIGNLSLRDIIGADLAHVSSYADGLRALGCIQWFMQINTDRHLGRVAPCIEEKEALAMRRIFGLHIGWNGVYDEDVIRAARDDGISIPGKGRFSGKIERINELTPLERYAGIFYAKDEEDQVQAIENYNTDELDNNYNDEAGLESLQRGLDTEAGYKVTESVSARHHHHYHRHHVRDLTIPNIIQGRALDRGPFHGPPPPPPPGEGPDGADHRILDAPHGDVDVWGDAR